MTTATATPERLYLMQVATGTMPTDPPIHMSVGCYLVQMSDGQNVLIDSGLPPDFETPAGAPQTELGRNVIEHLAELGLKPEDIDILVCTHLDVDHAGFHERFTSAELVIQRQQYELARSGYPRFAGGRDHWDHPALTYRLVDGDTELLPGVTLLETSGHVPGHQSVLVRLPRTGPVLLAIDAVNLERNFTPDRQVSSFDDDEAQLRASTRKLLDLADREHVALTVFHHDGEQWESLSKSPEWYG